MPPKSKEEKESAPEVVPANFDALEAAKVVEAPKAAANAASSVLKLAESDAFVVLPEPPKPAVVTKMVVARKVTVSWGGQMLNLGVGDVISEESYGPGAIQRMRDAGVAFEEPKG